VAVVLVVSVWNWFNNSRNSKAQDEIYAAQFLFEAGHYDEALAQFEDVIDSYGSTKTGNLAKAYAGLCQKELKNYDEAIKYLKQFSGNDQLIAPAIEAALGDCYVETDQYAEAAKCFEKAAAATDNEAFSPLYLKKAGLAYEAQGDKNAALKAYNAIKDNWLQTTIGQDKYIYRVQH
jgi:tetratricopeptide (TPR) repeat protein